MGLISIKSLGDGRLSGLGLVGMVALKQELPLEGDGLLGSLPSVLSANIGHLRIVGDDGHLRVELSEVRFRKLIAA